MSDAINTLDTNDNDFNNYVFPPGTKAFSYLRLSSKRQLSGDGFRRQREAVDSYCQENQLILDEELSHIGSAYTGANVIEGTAIAEFLRRVRTGQIPRKSVLLVESLDRLSRDHVLKAQSLFTDIICEDIILVTLADKKVYTENRANSNWTQLIISLSVMARAQEESKTKADRLAKTWVKNVAAAPC